MGAAAPRRDVHCGAPPRPYATTPPWARTMALCYASRLATQPRPIRQCRPGSAAATSWCGGGCAYGGVRGGAASEHALYVSGSALEGGCLARADPARPGRVGGWPCLLKTLERYQRYIYSSADAAVPSSDEMQNNYQEYVKLKTRVEVLQHSQRNLLGEDLAPLSTSELDQLEIQVDKTLKQIRSRKTQVLLDELCDLKRKEQMLQDANRVLKRKLDEVEAEAPPPSQLPWQGGSSDAMLSDGPTQPEHFFQALESNPSLHPTFHTMDMNQQPVPTPGGCYPPAWMA
nr:unnamed protein product [Digitaria exilis]